MRFRGREQRFQVRVQREGALSQRSQWISQRALKISGISQLLIAGVIVDVGCDAK